MSDHISKSFDEDLAHLRQQVTRLGGLAEQLTMESVQALIDQDINRATAVIAADQRLDRLQREIEEYAVSTIARRAPVAIDLREVVAANRMAGDLERIGDLAKNIAKRVTAISSGFERRTIVAGIEHMSKLVEEQLKDVLDAYGNQDLQKALNVWESDGEIDQLYTSLFRELLTYMMEDPRNISFCTHLLFCAKNIERIGDHATNIAETVHYLVTGSSLDAERPKHDRSSFENIGAHV